MLLAGIGIYKIKVYDLLGRTVYSTDLAQIGEVVFSKRFMEIHGFAAHELENQAEAWQARIHPDDLARIEADRLAYFSGEKSSYAATEVIGRNPSLLASGTQGERGAHATPGALRCAHRLAQPCLVCRPPAPGHGQGPARQNAPGPDVH